MVLLIRGWSFSPTIYPSSLQNLVMIFFCNQTTQNVWRGIQPCPKKFVSGLVNFGPRSFDHLGSRNNGGGREGKEVEDESDDWLDESDDDWLESFDD